MTVDKEVPFPRIISENNMQKRTSLSLFLSPSQKSSLVDHSIWSVDSLSEEDKKYVSEKLAIGRIFTPKRKFIVPQVSDSDQNGIEYKCGINSIDSKISPLLKSVVTEFSGEPGSGRTSICLRYAANLPEGKKTLWIDTEGSLIPPKGVVLNVVRPLDFIMFFAMRYQIPRIAEEMGDELGLIVIDSIAAPLRGKSAVEIASERTNMLWEMVKMLKSIAVERGIAVLLTNHLSMTIFHGVTRTLGNSWSHAPTHCFEIKKHPSGRFLKIIKSPCLPKTEISFVDNDDVV